MAHNAGANPNSPTREYVYSGAGVLATIEGGATKYHLSDYGSARVTADSSGTLIGRQGHYLFGEQWYTAVTQSAATKWQFTSYGHQPERAKDAGYSIGSDAQNTKMRKVRPVEVR